MSAQYNTYLMLGVIYPYPDDGDFIDKLEPLMDSAFKPARHFNQLTVLADGMNGEYLAIGHVFARTDNEEGFDGIISIPQDVSVNTLIGAIFEQFPPTGGKPESAYREGWHVITHYR